MSTNQQPQANIMSIKFAKTEDERKLLKRLKKTAVLFKNKTIKHA